MKLLYTNCIIMKYKYKFINNLSYLRIYNILEIYLII